MDILYEYCGDSVNYIHKNTSNTDDYIYDMHTHDCYELVLVSVGSAQYLVEGKSFPIKNKSLIITRPGDVHCIKINKNSPDRRMAFWFDSSKMKIDIDKFIANGINVVDITGNETINALYEKVDFYIDHFDGAELENILLNIIEEIFYNIKIIGEQDVYSENTLISNALKLIEENITEPFYIDKICSELFISKSYFHRMFMKHLHITPKKYITLKRLSMAQKQIIAGKKPTEVAYLCGFTDYSVFYRLYKKHFGFSPSDKNSGEFLPENLY